MLNRKFFKFLSIFSLFCIPVFFFHPAQAQNQYSTGDTKIYADYSAISIKNGSNTLGWITVEKAGALLNIEHPLSTQFSNLTPDQYATLAKYLSDHPGLNSPKLAIDQWISDKTNEAANVAANLERFEKNCHWVTRTTNEIFCNGVKKVPLCETGGRSVCSGVISCRTFKQVDGSKIGGLMSISCLSDSGQCSDQSISTCANDNRVQTVDDKTIGPEEHLKETRKSSREAEKAR